ncbi:MAG: ribonuclease J [Bacilli bacterium]|mgnify:CR=1 FL=1|nr:ribonuclease J [Bacilli bacterium]MDD3304545.1 ribonuclease J [Bacilli bacterium]MDD4053839.1 ribonuclease J [Bacilli bacterium]MDD4411294.1 ribonuclease J [Bacilli bacterium]
MKFFENGDTKVFALGGLGEVGKNMYCVMHNDEIIIVDTGVMFPQDELMGIDYVIPDFSFLKKNQDKIKGLFITHGHEDHIGGIPFLLQLINIPIIYAPKQATALIKKKIEERNIKYKNINIYTEKTRVKYKYFDIEFFNTTHSIPDSHGLAIHTPNGTIVMTGDFKFDFTPIGPMSNIHKMAEIGKKSVKLLLSDSTNALVDGFSISESKVDEALGDVFEECDGRIIIATFASNIYRLKHIVETCKKNNRKVALFGRSMETSIEIAISGGYIEDTDIFVTPEEANRMKANEIALLCTGSQGEPLAALSRIANGSHRQIKLIPGDVVVFSSSPIPGNAASISNTINKLYLKGVKVFTNTSLSGIHTSGHGNNQELKLMLRLFQPEYFMPYHGEYRMLKAHADLALECGIPKENIFVLDNGDVLSITKNGIKRNGTVQASDIYVDGNRIGDVGSAVIKDRSIMSDDGILVIIANIDINNNELLGNTNITTRGFVLVNESGELLSRIEYMANQIIKHNLKNKKLNYADLKQQIIAEVSPFIKDETGRKPIILPVFMEVKR